MNAIHISTARHILNAGDPVDISCWTAKGEIRHYTGAVSLRYDLASGTRNLKLLKSGQIRRIRECLIFRINGMEVYL